MANSQRIIMGIDPGTATVGFAVITGTVNRPVILDYGVIVTQKSDHMSQRLLQISQDLCTLLQKYKPTHAVVEEIFFATNLKTAVAVAQARGVVLVTLAQSSTVQQINTITPLQLKQTITGYGAAKKKQMQTMVQKLFQLDSLPKPDDAADALGLAWYGLLDSKHISK